MNGNQKKVIGCHLTAIIDALEGVAEIFLCHLKENGVISYQEKQHIDNTNTNDRGKLWDSLQLLPAKKNGWEVMISYLEEKNHSVYKSLEDSLKELGKSSNSAVEPTPEFLLDFKATLAEFYISQYSKVRVMYGGHRDVNEIWVPLRLEEKTRSLRQEDNFNHIGLLERLAGEGSYSVALVKGHPGVGKTTLVQKIAYDWAAKKAVQFDLILTVPLRYVGKTLDFLELAADYYTNQLGVSPVCKEELLKWLKTLGKKLLICFDGLDEYGNLAESPFKAMFQKPRATNKQCPIPFLRYKLLITSRPYACEFINRDFSPLRFEISPLDEAHLTDFVQHYCETDEGKKKVTNYVKDHCDLVIKVPLILTFVCYLADLREEIPTNLTLLYDKLLGHMVKREMEINKLAIEVEIDDLDWKGLAVTKATAKLAFEGCKARKFQFRPSLDLDVTKDSFTCGFLLHTFNFREESLYAEFPHRSVQEVFAAIYCCQLISMTDKMERNSVMKEILNGDSQFGRFFCGLCSVERKKFEEMLDWLNPTFGDATMFTYQIGNILSRLSDCMSDCSEAELFGRRLAASLDQLENQMQKEKEERRFWIRNLDLPLSNKTLQSGLNLNGTQRCWFISHVDKPRCSRLTHVEGDLTVDLREKFDKIQILNWVLLIDELAEKIPSVDQLPDVSTLTIRTVSSLEVNFLLEYETTTTKALTSATTQLRHFCFQFDQYKIDALKRNFKDQLNIDGLIIGESHKTGKKAEISWVTVTVKHSYDRSHLVKMLIRLALESSTPSL